MFLREDQIQRYGRQILLREVSVRGQMRLLSHPIRIVGENAATPIACAYLAAGGSPLDVPHDMSLSHFFLRHTDLDAFNSDVRPQNAPWAELRAAGTAGTPKLPAVVIGADGVAFASEDSCSECFTQATHMATDIAAENIVLFGTLAALLLQRLVFGYNRMGLIGFVNGVLQFVESPTCFKHAKGT